MGPFHDGELEVQERVGVRHQADRVGNSIHDGLPEVAADFLRTAPLIVTGLLDPRGRPWAAPIAGLPGAVDVPDERTLVLRPDAVSALLPEGSPAPGDVIGVIALEPATRRRVRINGRVASAVAGEVVVAVEQAYANCPKYIQKRVVAVRPSTDGGHSITRGSAGGARPAGGATLFADQRRRIEAADTFFIASAHPDLGADASHRGGLPGFVSATEAEISWPDYPGNRMFNTLGNLAAHPRAGLLFLDFETGDTLRVTGTTRIAWNAPGDADAGRIGRRVTLSVERVIETAGELPLAFELLEYSPHNPALG
ncbi:MAG: pyridoxamine 5'-phosphate oxidase family protein [Gemmatimonadota bacterium]